MAEGSEVAAKVLIQYGDFIRAIINYKIPDKAQVDDLFQDFFLSLMSNPVPLDIDNVKSYLYKAVVNDVADALRRTERYRSRVARYVEHVEYDTTEPSPEDVLIGTEQTNEMFRLLERQLPRSEARALTLRYKESYDISEIAGEMDVDKRTVSRYISGGLSKMRRFFAYARGS